MENHKIDLVPIFSRVVILKSDTPEKIGLIYVPSNSAEAEPTEGVVVARGDECEVVHVGDRVFFGKYSGFKFERDGNTYIFCNEEDILAKIEQEEVAYA